MVLVALSIEDKLLFILREVVVQKFQYKVEKNPNIKISNRVLKSKIYTMMKTVTL